ncbi:hypothetical protein TH66_00400 [Carbonactinospora thermoautotrophica]|uniref:DUF3800 domain-containing protein n=1 Tax=Carbonactinospora thermoautotrophica TaxID=1469144 RepID=A0A132NG93_9ACTN|nr:hypothetical protein [Carbonactinospora thermoautotrophica]KWX05839.1 hypothetical protein TH66_00400 [Carbonactinospora thermoautotrophica]KWX08987.1 hypothetical protein TR74_12310 [Carbonactinospora thermoautotrophica]
MAELRVAYADESFLAHDGTGVYVLAAALLPEASWEDARDVMRDLLRAQRPKAPPGAKLHWAKMPARARITATKTVADVGGLHVVAVGAPCPSKRQERARAACLKELVRELYDFGVRVLRMEAREKELNDRDRAVVNQARQMLGLDAEGFRVEHVPGPVEPLLWLCDIVAGAVRLHRLGESMYREALGDVVLDFDVVTDC